VAVGQPERSSSSSSNVSEEEGKARTPDVEVPPDDQVEDPARLALIAKVEEIAPGKENRDVRRAILDAVPGLLKTARLAGSPSPFDHVRMAIEKAASNPKRRDTIEGLARGILRNWVDEGLPAIHAPEPPGKPKPPPDTAAEAEGARSRRRAELAAEALRDRWNKLPVDDPERRSIGAEVDRVHPELAEIKPDCARKAARHILCVELLGRREQSAGSPRPVAVEPVKILAIEPPPVATKPPVSSLASAVDRHRAATRGLSDPTPPPSVDEAEARELARNRQLAMMEARSRTTRVEPSPSPVVEPAPIRAAPIEPPPARPSIFRRVRTLVASLGIL
jgi:hypothetical protein